MAHVRSEVHANGSGPWPATAPLPRPATQHVDRGLLARALSDPKGTSLTPGALLMAQATLGNHSVQRMVAQMKGAGAEKKPVSKHAAEALLISFPDYKVDTETFLGKVGGLGHAGVLLIREDGLTRYYEYGRYLTKDGTKGRVREEPVPPVIIGEDGRATPASLEKALARISAKSGQGGRIEAAYFQNVDYAAMQAHAQRRLEESNPELKKRYRKDRAPYDLQNNNCATFAEEVITRDQRVDQPSIAIHSPINTVSEYEEEGNARVTYDPRAKQGERLTIGEWDEADAKVQRRSEATHAPVDPEEIRAAAAVGVTGGGMTLPYLNRIQASFGPEHDLSSVRAHVGGRAEEASRAMGAVAYTTGEAVAFREAPDLFTTAHEAAHVIQQRAGISLPNGVGLAGDAHEQHADAVAQRVVRGESSRGLLDSLPGAKAPSAGSSGPVTQQKGGFGDLRIAEARIEE